MIITTKLIEMHELYNLAIVCGNENFAESLRLDILRYVKTLKKDKSI